MLFPFENISNDRNQERKLNNNPNWLERCNSIELSFSTSFSLAKSLSKLLKIRSVYRNYETSLSRTIYLSSRADDRYYNVHCVFPEWTTEWSLDFDTMRSPFNIPAILCLCPAILFLSFFFLNFHTDIVIRHCYTSCKWKTIIYSTCCVNKVKFSKWNLIFDRIKRKKFVSKGLRGKLRREI